MSLRVTGRNGSFPTVYYSPVVAEGEPEDIRRVATLHRNGGGLWDVWGRPGGLTAAESDQPVRRLARDLSKAAAFREAFLIVGVPPD